MYFICGMIAQSIILLKRWLYSQNNIQYPKYSFEGGENLTWDLKRDRQERRDTRRLAVWRLTFYKTHKHQL